MIQLFKNKWSNHQGHEGSGRKHIAGGRAELLVWFLALTALMIAIARYA